MPSNPYYDGPPSDHFDGLRFFNPGHAATDRSLGDMLRWKLREKAARWPNHILVAPTVPDRRVERVRVTMVGHATLLIQIAGRNLLTDPWWSARTSPVSFIGPKRVTDPGIAFDDLPPIDAVLLSHNHYDHLDLPTLKRLDRRDHPLIVTPLGNDRIVRRAIPEARLAVGDWHQRFDLGDGIGVTIVPAHHWSSRTASDRRMALWSGFMVQAAVGSVYFAGDTGYGDGAIFREMRERYGAPDLALIPIGAYSPRWFMSAQHTDPDEAVRIMLDLGAGKALGIHWGSIQLTDEARDEPAELLAAALAHHKIDPARFIAAESGTVAELG